ncbi:DUF4982 domain-containing protein [Clostridium estertheticum]|uniref:glycoside hydrolase family 2 TIM barrel-domain containing protein n=1 Tax=Clostridium estertheticum TaxID=238834 RepID=UPI001C0C6A2F|nr:glycoside hydrolase family 2 TIM barrel-domain containing protein [Clostridium estertheticum]MBU3201387.1 DUF4982 domain-containing protein [Clostridium estertheticum]WAG66500.1 DUF4982 domain-containing protein [Clostridium estertheticum]
MNNNNVRTVFNLNLDWKFKLNDETNAWQKGFDDTSWENINIPHDWSVNYPFDIKNSSGTGYLPGGIGFYRKKFFLPKELEGKRVYVTFDGVYNNSMVWCNSYYVGKRPNGYTEIIYDITDFACFGDMPNVLTVKVDHKCIEDSRWFTGSGIYRKVTVEVKNKICIDSHGVFISTKNVSNEKAKMSVQTSVINTTDEDIEVKVKNFIYDDKDNLVSFIEGEQTVLAGGNIANNKEMFVDMPKLWSINTPNLYTCFTVIEKDGIIIDQEKIITGIRTFEFNADKGFFLNGESMKLKGVCVHHDAGCLGAAVRKKVWERRLLSLQEMGCNAIRMSHNPHMPELYDLCDELGFLVIDEAFDEWEGVKNKWSKGHNVYPPAHYGYYEDFPEWHERDIATMILRDRNHPSIILWSIGNEIDYPNDPYGHPFFETMTGNNDENKPAAERIYDPNKPNAQRIASIAKELVSIVKNYDLTRPVTAALAFPELSNFTGYADCLDVVGYNYKEHLYEEDHKKYPNRILMGSENGKGLEQWLAVEKNEYISGQFLWTGIDYLGETKIWPSHGSQAGLLDVAGFEKPSYYFRKSIWSNKPMIKIFATNFKTEDLSARWNFINNEEVKVTCFTNCEKTELFLNEKSLGIRNVKDYDENYITWTVPFEKGILKAISTDGEGKVYEDILITAGAAAGIRLQCKDEVIASDGLDMTHIELNIIDLDGNTIHNAQDLIHVSIEGPAKLLGLENGNLEDITTCSLPHRRAYNGKLLVYISSTTEKGIIKIKVQGEKLGLSEISIISK